MAEFHEENLSTEVKDYHRIIKSLIEELEAVDWYNQRADATDDSSVQGIVEHNRDEEIEHACMALEWLRRRYPEWEENLKTFLFTEGDITELEEEGEEAENSEGSSSLDIGNLK
ncbi:MAG: encapsulin-associated ferritin-like protein [Halanaerobiaceae bacterium]